jgi:hypothetical protein
VNVGNGVRVGGTAACFTAISDGATQAKVSKINKLHTVNFRNKIQTPFELRWSKCNIENLVFPKMAFD